MTTARALFDYHNSCVESNCVDMENFQIQVLATAAAGEEGEELGGIRYWFHDGSALEVNWFHEYVDLWMDEGMEGWEQSESYFRTR